MSNFKVERIGERHWAVFLVNPNDPKDRYMLTSSLDRESEAEEFRREFERINSMPKKEDFPVENLNLEREITLEDGFLTELEGRSKNEP